MATKKQIIELQNEITRLSRENDDLKMKLVGANRTIDDLIHSNNDFRNINNHLADERDRISRSDNIHKENCISLMNAITILGKHEMQRISNEVWHTCQPRQMETSAIDTDSYFEANKHL